MVCTAELTNAGVLCKLAGLLYAHVNVRALLRFNICKACVGKKEIDEEMVDRIVEETKKQKNLKEQIYDKINLPVWVLDIVIALLVIGFIAVIIFGRG